MENDRKPWLNSSGYHDPTAYAALNYVAAEENKVDNAAHMVVTTIKNILDLSGFELTERIQIKHKKSGKIYK